MVLGAGGFIGSYLVSHLKREGNYVCGIDLKAPAFSPSLADRFEIGDLRDMNFCRVHINNSYDEVYQLAADMGGAGYLFSGENDFNVMSNSAMVNLNVLDLCVRHSIKKVFFSSSACMYPKYNQEDPQNPLCKEDSAYPAAPDSEYGWEKLFSERLYLSAHRNFNLNIRIARFHNIYGPYGVYKGGKEKAPAAICRKVAEAEDGGEIEIWGSGRQTRSFLYIDDCIKGVVKLMQSDCTEPVNIGSEEMISINDFARMIIKLSGKTITIKNVEGFVGVNGRTSDNTLVKQKTGWAPEVSLLQGITVTYQWIVQQVMQSQAN